MSDSDEPTLDVNQKDVEDALIGSAHASYMERALSTYLRSLFFGGFDILKSRSYLGYFIYTVIIVIGTIVMGILNHLNILVSANLLQAVILIGVLTGVAMIVGGIIGGLMQKILDAILIIFMASVLVFVWFFPTFGQNLIAVWIKIVLFLVWTAISGISMFYIFLYFHSSLSYRVITLGNSPNRLFLSPILRGGVWIGLILFVYLFSRDTIDAQVLGLYGIFVSLILLYYLYNLPLTVKHDDTTVRDAKMAQMLFRQALGFFNLYLLYHIIMSYDLGTSIGNILAELLLLIINTLYMINGLARKVENIHDIEKEEKNRFQFQRTSTLFMRIKKTIGTKSLIIITLGIALSYHCIMLESYLGQTQSILQSWIGPNVALSTFYHRAILFISLTLIVISLLFFRYSQGFRDMCVNRYSFRHAIQMFGDLFRRKEDGTPTIIQEAGERMKNSLQQYAQRQKESREAWKQKWSSRRQRNKPSENENSPQ